MTSIFNVSNSIGKTTAIRLKEIGIDSIEKLASSSVEDLLVIEGIGVSTAKTYIQFAKKHLQRINARSKVYNIINKGIRSDESRSVDRPITKQQIDKKNIPRVPISSIKKIASSSIEELSKTNGLDTAKAQKYIEIAQKYLVSMRKEEIANNALRSTLKQQDQPLGFVKFDYKSSSPRMEPIASTKQKEDSSIEKPHPDYKTIKKPTLNIKPLKKATFDIKLNEKPSQRKVVKAKIAEVKVDKQKQPEMQTFFPLPTMQKIRFLHFSIKKLENILERNEAFSFSELNNILEYIKILNVNYKTQSQIKIFKELEITPSFYDPIARKEIKIWDLIFECSRALWVSAKAYSYLSTKFEAENLMEKAIVAMVECSKMFKTAAYFSAACTRQEDEGIALSVNNLEMNSEEARILAQNLATISEEKKGNFSMASNLSAGLSALTKRLAFLRKYDKKKEYQFKAQYNYDMGRACSLKAKYLLKLAPKGENEENIEKLQKKANFYYINAEEIWESMLNNFENLSDAEKESLRTNLSIVNNNIIENDVEIINEVEALEIQDPEPLIIIPENLAPFVPRTTNFLTKYSQADLNFDAYLRYKHLMSEVAIDSSKIEELQNNKAGIGRTLKQLKILYDNNDIDINSFTELFEKYSIKLEGIEAAIQNLKKPNVKSKEPEDQKHILKSIM